MWCHNGQNDVPVVYGALGDFVDLAKDVICVVVYFNMCVGVCVCACVKALRVFAHVLIL